MMYYSLPVLALLALGLAPSITLVQSANTCSDDDNALGTIVDIACAQANADRFGTLCLRLRNTGLDDSLTTSGDWFVFAPDNSAFTLAGTTAGVTLQQQANALRYHISVNTVVLAADALACGTDTTSILSINGIAQTSTTQCDTDGTTKLGQAGDVRLPTPTSSFPLFSGGTDDTDFILACNGIIVPLGGVLGFDTAAYSFGVNGCSFFDPNCVRIRTGKATKKGGFVTETVVNGVAFDNVFYQPKAAKKGGYYRPWNGLNQFQTVYANDAINAFSPYFRPQQRPYYGNKKGKAGKGYYGYGNGYNNYGNGFNNGFNNGFRNNGYYGIGNRNRGYYGKGSKGYYRKLEKESVVFDNGVSVYEPEEYYEYDAQDAASPEQ